MNKSYTRVMHGEREIQDQILYSGKRGITRSASAWRREGPNYTLAKYIKVVFTAAMSIVNMPLPKTVP